MDGLFLFYANFSKTLLFFQSLHGILAQQVFKAF